MKEETRQGGPGIKAACKLINCKMPRPAGYKIIKGPVVENEQRSTFLEFGLHPGAPSLCDLILGPSFCDEDNSEAPGGVRWGWR